MRGERQGLKRFASKNVGKLKGFARNETHPPNREWHVATTRAASPRAINAGGGTPSATTKKKKRKNSPYSCGCPKVKWPRNRGAADSLDYILDYVEDWTKATSIFVHPIVPVRWRSGHSPPINDEALQNNNGSLYDRYYH